jgi:hypothetical protein
MNTHTDTDIQKYVVTRDGRRTSEKNFVSEHDAKWEASYWIDICRQYDPKSKVSIVRTNKPKRIR